MYMYIIKNPVAQAARTANLCQLFYSIVISLHGSIMTLLLQARKSCIKEPFYNNNCFGKFYNAPRPHARNYIMILFFS